MLPIRLRRALRVSRRIVLGSGRGRGVILMYHRVTELENDPWDLCVSPRNFAAQMAELRRLGRVEKVRDLLSALGEGGRAPVFAVSFDDGYADNAAVAQPILEAHAIPATFFIVGEAIGAREEFWWDALDRVFLRTETLPSRLELAIGERIQTWHLGEVACYSREAMRRDAAWRADGEGPHGPRQTLFLELWELLGSRMPDERDRLAREILAWAGLEATARPDYAAVTEEQFTALAEHPLLEIGGHTRTHPSLPDLPLKAQVEEIAGGKAALEARLGLPVVTFSYPHGRFTEETKAAVREAGFTAACTSRALAVSGETGRFTLPRLQVKDWDGPTFRKRVMSLF